MERRANSLRGEVALTLGGCPYVLRPSFAAIVAIEERLGGVIGLALKASKGELSLREMAVLIFETLEKHESDAPSEDEIGERILDDGLASVAPVVSALLAAILKGNRRDEG
jgi:Phage tail tube protein, GTA-gp10